jgi:iron complex outermembrane receptor protein
VGFDYWSIRRRDSLQLIPEAAIFTSYAENDPVSAGGRIVRQPRLPGGGCEGDGDIPTPAGAPCPIDYVIALIENLGKYNTSGVDVSATFKVATGYGTLTFRGEGTYFLMYRYQQEANGPYFDNVGRSTADNGVITRWRHYVSLNWRNGPWGATLSQTFILGSQDEDRGMELPPRRVASWESWDIQGTWEGWRGLKVTAGMRNLLDRDPPASRNGNTFQQGYDPRYYDPRGRTYVLGLTYAVK